MFNMTDDQTDPSADVEAFLASNYAAPDEINPPDVDPMGLLDRGHECIDLGIAGQYAATMYDLVGSSRNYHELAGLAMVGACIQHRFLPMTWAQRQKLRPNLYAVLLGRTSLDHKSTALTKPHETLPWDHMPNCASLPGMFTEEGLYKELSERPIGLIVRDEIAVLFASRNRKYTEFVVPFLTDAFGGWMYAKRLSQASYSSREISLTILGATTYSEFAKVTSESDWSSGWLVRWLFAMPDKDYDATKDTRWPTDADHAQLDEIKRRLSEMNTRNPGPMTAEKAAFDYLNDWRKTLIRAAMRESDRHERVDAIIERYATYAYKFAMILCAARGDGERVTAGQASDACRLAENYMSNVFALYQYQKENRMTGSLLQDALDKLWEHRAKGLTGRELSQLCHLNATMRDEVITRLSELGVIGHNQTGKTTRYYGRAQRIPPQRLG